MIEILWADDNAKVLFSGRMLLENDKKHRYNIHEVHNGQQAIIVSKVQRFDLCIMDVNMPQKNGIEAAQEIHSLNTFGYMPIIGATAGNTSVLPRDIFDDVIEKPFDIEELLRKIDQWYIHTLVIEKDFQTLTKELPMDQNESTELLELRKRDLGYLRLRGTGDKFVVHKNVQNKISYDFAHGKQLSEFIDRSKKEPGKVHLYKENFLANHWELTVVEVETLSLEEDKLLSDAKYQKKTDDYASK